jgi:glycosyltransferase involved in cell wall biosynthesis
MRICHILETAGGGSAQIVLSLARYALGKGDQVTIVYAPDRAEFGFLIALSSLPGVKIRQSPMQRTVGLRDLRDGWLLLQMLRVAGPFDIIHAHSSKAGALARIAGLFLPGSVIYTPHCFFSMSPHASPIYALIERILGWISAKIVVASRYEFQHALEIGIAKNKIAFIANGVAASFCCSRNQARGMLGVDSETVLIGFVGRLETQKNPIRAIQVFHEIANRFPFIRLIMVGDGTLRPAIEETLGSFELNDRVSLLGHFDARNVFPAFDCLLCSSDFEGLSLTFLEALAAGVPIITTPVGGAEEAAIHGVTGFVAKDATAEALVVAAEEFLMCPREQRQRMIENAKKHSELFTTVKMGEKYAELYWQCRWANQLDRHRKLEAS